MFGRLHHDIFTVFVGPNRELYELALVRIYQDFFRADLHFPTSGEVVALVYELLAEHPELWREDEAPTTFDQLRNRRGRRLMRRGLQAADAKLTSEAMVRSRHIYNRFVETGWLEEGRFGLKVTVDMPAGAMQLTEFLCGLHEGTSEQLAGLVVQVKHALDGVRAKPAENAPGLYKAARDAAAFGRYLRSVLSALRDIDREVVESENVEQRLRHYFEGFIERLLLRDYASITTTSHPYRYRQRIIDRINEIEDSPVSIATLAIAYSETRLVDDATAARDAVFDDLMQIRHVFERIEDVFERIQQHRSKLEARLHNTVRYAGRRTGAYLERCDDLLAKLDRLAANDTNLAIPSTLETQNTVLSPDLLARPRGARDPIPGGELALPSPDPMRELRRRLEREYLDRLRVTPRQIERFLDRRVPPDVRVDASRLWIEGIDDFLAFEALRLAVAVGPAAEHELMARLWESYDFAPSGNIVENGWLSCLGFTVQRKDVTKPGANHVA